MAFVPKIPISQEEVDLILKGANLKLPQAYDELLKFLAQKHAEGPVTTEETGRLLKRLAEKGLIKITRQTSTRSMIQRALSVINGKMVTAKVRLRVSYMDRNQLHVGIHSKRARTSTRTRVTGHKDQRANIEHGLWACREFGCVISACKNKGSTCEFARALKALDGFIDEEFDNEESSAA
jgi:hypothetical protein